MANLKRSCILLAILTCAASTARADVHLAGIFGDHMVLQRNAHANLWGTAEPGELIHVRPSWYENDAAVTAGPDGRFLVSLTTPADPGPHTIALRGKNEVVLNDVLLGEVWLASGQSNMEMCVGFLHGGYSGVQDWEQELTDADRPRIRLFTVEDTASPGPQSDARGHWSVADASSVKVFSAVGWFFAKRLERELDAPIGVVASDWGGTPAEAWTSAHGLAGFPQYAAALEDCQRFAADPETAAATRGYAAKIWGRTLTKQDPLSVAGAQAPGFDDSSWGRMQVPGNWAGDLANFDGVVWMRREIELPVAWAGKELELHLGPIDDDEWTFFDGELVGSTEGWDVPRTYTIPSARVKAGRASLAVRILDTGGEGGLRGSPADLWIAVAGTQQKLPLAGEWRLARGAALADLPPKPPVFVVGSHTPSALFNGMIAPITNFKFAGALWYQGESNVGRAEEYSKLFPAMIRDWRSHFATEFPFLFVQIAPFGYGNDHGAAGDLREAQAAALDLPKTGMVVTLDIGNPADIHPKNKQEVGRRLALLALREAYGRSVELRPSPRAASARREGDSVVLQFQPGGLSACGESAFELAGADGAFHPAVQVSVESDRVVLQSPEVPEPTRLRYAWGATATPSIRAGEDQMPIAPFRLEVH